MNASAFSFPQVKLVVVIDKKNTPPKTRKCVISDKLIISLRTVAALRKHSGGMFLAVTATAVP